MMIKNLLQYSRKIGKAEVSEHVKRLRSMGYTKVDEAINADLVCKLLSMVQYQYTKIGSKMAEAPGEWDADWILNLQNKDKEFIDLLDLPVVEVLMKELLNDPYMRHLPPNDPNYILGQFVARSSTKPLELHIDAGMPQPGLKTNMVQLGFALEDANEHNGCTIVVPGSHLMGEYSDRQLEHVYPVSTVAGDLVIWDARLWHGAAENNSDHSRWSIVATFQRWWVKQSFDIPRALPDEIFQNLSHKQKAVLGFCTIPPLDETERRTRARGYQELKAHVADFYSQSHPNNLDRD